MTTLQKRLRCRGYNDAVTMATDKHLSDQSRINDDAAPPRYRRVWTNVVKPRVFLIPRRWHGGSEFHKHNYNTVDLSKTTLY